MRRFQLIAAVLISCAAAQQHYIDVRELVRDTIDAIKEAPQLMNRTEVVNSTSAAPAVTQPPEDVYKSLLKLPADIMDRLMGITKSTTSPPEESTTVVVETTETAPQSIEKSFKTLEDIEEEEKRKVQQDTPTVAKKNADEDDVFSIGKLISATGDALKEMKKTQTTTEAPQTEIVYRPVLHNGKKMYIQIVLLKSADGSSKVVAQNMLNEMPVIPEPIKKNVENANAFAAPTFPPVVNVFDPLSFPKTDETTVVTPKEEVTTEASTTTTDKGNEDFTPKKKLRKISKIAEYEKKVSKSANMHSREFGAKTVQMSDPIAIEPSMTAVEDSEKPNKLRIRTLKRKSSHHMSVEADSDSDVEEPLKKKRKVMKKVHKKLLETKSQEIKKAKKIRKLVDLYEHQPSQAQVAPSVSPPSEEFSEQMEAAVESQTSATMSDEEILNTEIHKRVMHKIKADILRKSKELETTAEEDVESVKKNKSKKKKLVSKQQCLNLRSFSKQFLFDNIADFANEHCYFIANYYPQLTCDRVSTYVAKCQKYLKESST